MEQVVQLNLATPSLLFSAISLILLAYTNRFLAYASVIRNLNNEERTATDAQIANLLKRIKLVRAMQMLGVLSLLSSLMAMFFLYIRLDLLGHIIFGIGMLLLGISLVICVWEIWISTQAIKTHLYQIEKRSRPNNKSAERQQQYADKARSNQKSNGSSGNNTPSANGNRPQQEKSQPNNKGAQQQTKGQDKPAAQQPSQQNGKQQPSSKSQEKPQDREPSNGREQGNGKSQQERQAQQTTRTQRSQERIESKVPAIVPKATTALLPVAVGSEAKREHTTNPKAEHSQAPSSQEGKGVASDTPQENVEASSNPNSMRQGRRNLRTQRSEETITSTSLQDERAENPQPRVRPEQRHERTSDKRPAYESKKETSSQENTTTATAPTPPNTSEDMPQRIREHAPRVAVPTEAKDSSHNSTLEAAQEPIKEQPRSPKVEPPTTEPKVSQEASMPKGDVTNAPTEIATAEPRADIIDKDERIEPKMATASSGAPQATVQTPRTTARNVNPARARLPRIPQQPRPARPVIPTAEEASAPATPADTAPTARQDKQEGAITEQ